MVCLSLRLASWNVSSKITSPSWRWQFLRLAAPRGSGDRRVTSSPWLSVQQVPCHAKKQTTTRKKNEKHTPTKTKPQATTPSQCGRRLVRRKKNRVDCMDAFRVEAKRKDGRDGSAYTRSARRAAQQGPATRRARAPAGRRAGGPRRPAERICQTQFGDA